MSSFVLGVMGSGDRRGRWRVPARMTVVNVMGGADLDLREAVLDGPEVEITVWSLMGGSDIVVPEGVHVELGGFAVMGGNDLRLEARAPAARRAGRARQGVVADGRHGRQEPPGSPGISPSGPGPPAPAAAALRSRAPSSGPSEVASSRYP